MTTCQQSGTRQPRQTVTAITTASSVTTNPEQNNNRINCVVAIITDDDSDAETLKDNGGEGEGIHNSPTEGHDSTGLYGFEYDSSGAVRSKMIKHIASSSSVSTMDTDLRPNLNCFNSHSQTQLNGTSGGGINSSKNNNNHNNSVNCKILGGRPYSGNNACGSCVPILLSVPSAGPPRRRHSWICR